MKISVIVTVFNEEKTIQRLLAALDVQTRKPDEIVIVDGGSTDTTVALIKDYKKTRTIPLTVSVVKGNRSIGRNAAIKEAQFDWIAITDAGCIQKKDWLETLETCQKKSVANIIAGNQVGRASTPFEEAVIPYVLVMQDNINEQTYLPATRSVLMEKKVWKEEGGFDEKLSLNEDYAFFKRVDRNKYKLSFCRESIIYWLPRKNLKEFYRMINNFAVGDAEAGIIRPKIYFLFFRYFILCLFLLIFLLTHNYRILHIIVLGAALYLFWAIIKNKKYTPKGWLWLPVLQLVADGAVMLGTIHGMIMYIFSERKRL